MLIVFNQIKVYSQQLTINETLTYIENIENKYQGFTQGGDKVTVDYNIDADGIFTKKILYTNENVTKTVTLIKVHVDDISKNFEYDGDAFINIKCKNRNCLEIEEDGTKYINKKPRKSIKNEGLHVYVIQEYNAKKIIKALYYVFSLVEDKNFNRDINDPFAINNNEIFNNDLTKSNKVKLDETNGTFSVKVNFGTLSENFILDSGASEVSLSNNLFIRLVNAKKILESDMLPDGLYKIADGTIISQKRVNLRELKVGAFIVRNITASIGNENSPLLLGKSFLDKFKNWSIDNQEQVLILSKH